MNTINTYGHNTLSYLSVSCIITACVVILIMHLLPAPYALVQDAQNAPLLHIAGTEPEKLRKEVRILRKSQNTIAFATKNTEDALILSSSLYPTIFLYSLADLEEARQSLLETPSYWNGHIYLHRLNRTLNIGKNNISQFKYHMDFFTNLEKYEHTQLYSLSGSITMTSLQEAVDDVLLRLQEVQAELKRRKQCYQGTRICIPKKLYISKPNSIQNIDHDTLINGRDFYLQVSSYYQEDVLNESYITLLSESSCARELSGPYAYTLITYPEDTIASVPHLVSTISFTKTNIPNAPMLEALATQDIQYALDRPRSFYICPEVQKDIGLALALRNTLEVAYTQSTVAKTEQEKLLETLPFIYEDVAKEYVEAALAETRQNEIQNPEGYMHYTDLALALNDGTAGLDILVRRIHEVLDTLHKRKRNGYPVHIDAENLFLTHSAFPSLFLTQSHLAGDTHLHLTTYIPKNSDNFWQSHVQYSDTEDMSIRAKMIEDTVRLQQIDNGY